MKFISTLAFSLLLGLAVSAQSPSKILSQAEKTMGGAKQLKGIRSIQRIGRIKRLNDGAEGNYNFQTSQPNLLSISYDLGGFETATGYNGRSGRTRNSRDGLGTLTGIPSIRLAAAATFRDNLWLRYKEEKSKLTSGGRAVIDGKNMRIGQGRDFARGRVRNRSAFFQ